MTISFNIEYYTKWGERLNIVGISPLLTPMRTNDGIRWTAEVELNESQNDTEITYRYLVERDGKTIRKEWNGLPRTLSISNKEKRVIVNDCWRDIPEEQFLYTSPFTEVWMARREETPPLRNLRPKLTLKAVAPRVTPECRLAVCGNCEALGKWNPEKAVLMSAKHFPEWEVELDTKTLNLPLAFKFVLLNAKSGQLEAWEEGDNRHIDEPLPGEEETLIEADLQPYFNLPRWKAAGVAVPVFSLRSEGDFGIGDFGDLKALVDWAALTRQKIIQLLPVNDTTMTRRWTDSYPYSAISIYALHPMYADIRQMPVIDSTEQAERLENLRRKLNTLHSVDYEAVCQAKWEYFRLFFKQEGKQTLSSDGFTRFFEQNERWLRPYAVFCCLRDRYRTADFTQWPSPYTSFDEHETERMCHPDSLDYPEIAIHYFIQYHLHLQLSAATAYARSKGVALKGDIPIGVSRYSVETWTEPRYFHLNGQAGAPPDDFAVNGQNWGFPTYDWNAMEQDGYQWWIRRLRKMSQYFDAYRIDHILGFFRIWEIPSQTIHGLLGQFSPALPMSREEIESYGLPFRKEYLTPRIDDTTLTSLFGIQADYVKRTFVEPTDIKGVYRMRPGLETQREVEAFLNAQGEEAAEALREKLYTLIDDVLFVADKRDPDKYHPRISAARTFSYRSLPTDEERRAFDRLYDHYYYHRHNEFWRRQAMKKLPRLTDATGMLVCGEDLGMIPACVPPVMNELRILSLEVQRMPKTSGKEFSDPVNYPYRSVCTVSTHDMSTLREWWKEDVEQTRRFYQSMLGHEGPAPSEATPQVCKEVIRANLEGGSVLCILSLQDWLSVSGQWRNPDADTERINVPSNPKHYWRYRMHLTLEQLLKADSLNQTIERLVQDSGRDPRK